MGTSITWSSMDTDYNISPNCSCHENTV